MSNTVTPTFTDNVSVIAAGTLSRGSTTRGTLDLRAKFGAYLMIKLGRGGTTAIDIAVNVLCRRVINNDTATAGGVQPNGVTLQSTLTAATSTTVNSDSNSGQVAVNVTSSAGFAAGQVICIQDSGGGTTRLEFHRVSKVAAGVITIDRNLQFTHTSAQADTVRNQADAFAPIWLAGGSLWEIIIDYGAATTGDTLTIVALAQTYDSDSIA